MPEMWTKHETRAIMQAAGHLECSGQCANTHRLNHNNNEHSTSNEYDDCCSIARRIVTSRLGRRMLLIHLQ